MAHHHPGLPEVGKARKLVPAEVVVGVDGSPASNLAVRWAAEYATARHRELRLVHGLGFVPTRGPVELHKLAANARARGAQDLSAAARVARGVDPQLRVHTEMSTARPVHNLIEHSKTAYLLVLGETGNHDVHSHFGATVSAVTEHAAGNVVVVHDTGTEEQIRRRGPVVVGVDGSAVGESAVAAAFEEASYRRCNLVAVHVWSELSFAPPEHIWPHLDFDTDEEEVPAQRLAGWQEKYPDVTVDRHIYLSGPAAHLTEWSHSAQLVVVGSCGRRGFATAVLGSTANFLVQHARCPVLVSHNPFTTRRADAMHAAPGDWLIIESHSTGEPLAGPR